MYNKDVGRNGGFCNGIEYLPIERLVPEAATSDAGRFYIQGGLTMEKFAVLCKNKADLDEAIKKFKRMGAKWLGIFDIVDDNWFHGCFPVWMLFENGGICWNEEKPKGFNPIRLQDLLESENQSITIYQKVREVIAKNNITGKTATAKCHPEDEFDFSVGARLALDRLFEPEEFVPYLKDVCLGYDYGKIGEPTNLLDSFENPLFVGDVVDVISKTTGHLGQEFVVKNKIEWGAKNVKSFVMGIEMSCKGGNDYGGRFLVVKTKDHSKVKHLEKHGVVTAILK